MATIPTYSIGDIIRTRGSLAGLIGRVIYYEPPDDDLEDHGGLCFSVLTVEPGCFWDQSPDSKVGTEESMCIYHPESEWYHKCGGGKEPEVLVPEMMDPSDWNSPEEMIACLLALRPNLVGQLGHHRSADLWRLFQDYNPHETEE